MGTARGKKLTRIIGSEIRTARRMAGVSQDGLGGMVGLSGSEIGRVERAEAPWLSVIDASRILSAVGLELWAKAYPAGPPLRDAGHGKLLSAFEARLPVTVTTQREWPIPGGRGQALDLLLRGLPLRTGVEAETVLEDEQGLQRDLNEKRGAARLERMILLVKDSARNRRILRAASGLHVAFPVGTRQVLAALSRGRDPGADGIVIL
jgi:transcriptional regulator with XRE-family HTH domain